MEELNEASGAPGGVGGVAQYWYWAGGSSAQLLWAISSHRKGFVGDSRFMPLKAFAVASLFVGATASATVASLQASGIQSMEDMKQLGSNIRTMLGKPPRPQDE